MDSQLHVLVIMRDEIFLLKEFLSQCKKGNVPEKNVHVCIDNATNKDSILIKKILNDYGINYIETNHECIYLMNNFYCAAESLVNSIKLNPCDVIYISPIDFIPTELFYKEIVGLKDMIFKQYGHKWQGSAGFMWGSIYAWYLHKYIAHGKRYHLQEKHIYQPISEYEKWKINSKTQEYKGEINIEETWKDFCWAPVIQSVKRWQELNGFKGHETFCPSKKMGYDIKYMERGSEDGRMISFMGISVFHYDQRMELHPKRIREDEGKGRAGVFGNMNCPFPGKNI